MRRATRRSSRLAEHYLRRDYGNPVEGYAGAEFALLKCLDLYHGPELDGQVRRYVPHPDWIGDKPAGRRSKLRWLRAPKPLPVEKAPRRAAIPH
ncbi:MAG: T6SS amidase immunity protein Tai4 family protein [Burkholderia cenocepacia]